jgi:hypothetical protein
MEAVLTREDLLGRESMLQLWEQARQIDPTLKVLPHQLPSLGRRRLQPTPFSRNALFAAMRRGKPIVFDDLAVPVRGEIRLGVSVAVLQAMRAAVPRRSKIRVWCGPSATQKYVTADELLRRWTGRRARVSVTDLHIRGTKVVRHIDCSQLGDFNLLAEAGGEVGDQEMLTMVISSAGTFTDSHSDDPDGSNHCFAGRKLWLVWDTFLGLSRQLDDVERVNVRGPQARFSMSDFLSVPGSRWFTVEAGQTLFLPGHLTHKVITLDDYLGVGSFFVMFPSYLRTLHRWTRHTPLWALNRPVGQRLELVDEITRRVIRKMNRLTRSPEAEWSRWGLAYLTSEVAEWIRTAPPQAKSLLLDRPTSAKFLRAVLATRHHAHSHVRA